MSLKYGISVRFDNDVRDLAKQFPKAASAVLNRGVAKAKTLIVDDTFQEINLPKKVIKKKIMTRNAKSNSLWATIRVSQRGINPYYFLKSKKPTTRREPVLLEIKRGQTIYPGNKFFANIGRKSGLLKVMRQPEGNPRDHLALMKYIKGSNVFDSQKITAKVRQFIEPYLQKELPRVVEAWYKLGKDLF